jgi:hypothetical protein
MLDGAYATRFDRLGSVTGSVVNYVIHLAHGVT